MSHHRSSGFAGTVLTGLVTATLVSIAGAQLAHAQQFTLVDETFTYTKALADAGQSHHFVKAVKQPAANWTAPVDYRKGTVHIRTEVLEKPAGGEITQWSICYFGNNGSSYGCSESGPYTTAGVVERDVGMLTWWQNETIDWTKGVKEMAFVMKDKDEAAGHTHKRKDPEHFFPTKVRITMVQVAAGATYDASKAGLPAPGGGGGATDAGSTADAPGAVADAGGGGGGGATGAVDAAAATGGAPGGATEGGSGGSSSASGGAGPGDGSGGAGSGSGGSPSGGGSGASGGSIGSASGGSSGGTSRSGGSNGSEDPPASSGSSPAACAIGSSGQAPGAVTLVSIVGLALALARRRRPATSERKSREK